MGRPRSENPLTWDELINIFSDGSDSNDPNFELEKHKPGSVVGEKGSNDDDELTDFEEEDDLDLEDENIDI